MNSTGVSAATSAAVIATMVNPISRALASDAARPTVMTRAISGRPARCLANRFTALGETVAPAEVPAYPIAYDSGKALHAAGKARGDFGWGAQWAGTGAPRARRMPAAQLVAELARTGRPS